MKIKNDEIINSSIYLNENVITTNIQNTESKLKIYFNDCTIELPLQYNTSFDVSVMKLFGELLDNEESRAILERNNVIVL